MKIEKDYIIKSPVDKVWAFVSKPKQLGSCMPDVESYEEKDSKNFIVKVKPKFAFLRTTITMDWKILTLRKNYGKLSLKGGSIGGSFNVIIELTAKSKGKDTLLNMTINIKERTGLIKTIPESVLNGSALTISDKIFDCVSKKI